MADENDLRSILGSIPLNSPFTPKVSAMDGDIELDLIYVGCFAFQKLTLIIDNLFESHKRVWVLSRI